MPTARVPASQMIILPAPVIAQKVRRERCPPVKAYCTSLAIVGICLTSNAMAEHLARFSLRATDSMGNSISSVSSGSPFLIEAVVQDIRMPPSPKPGVFQASLNARYDPILISIASDAQFVWGPTFNALLARPGNLSTAGVIQEAGAFGSFLTLPDNSPQTLYRVPAIAKQAGAAMLAPSFDGVTESLHNVLLYGDGRALLSEEIEFIGSSLAIVPEPNTWLLALLGMVGSGLFAKRRRH
jgi:PEP-CTERM motif-containing protein